MALYLNATSLLIPPTPKKSLVEDRRRNLQPTTNLSELIMRRAPTPQTLQESSRALHRINMERKQEKEKE
ncbi:hypothetical protein GYMLUDRAFT_73977 [Collybiopsis luxurians FD-317 M1]|uniref:Uncharacterized protein n=1 Tax=Collybiopsis luxurians FD-317 M1 TaxID=944289 RepID=A0A0D0CVS3_9AGAR|nr:hypothetical protein GYMLUDRAFT_73977 [Collybiopsis luxurians FD-317 M1]